MEDILVPLIVFLAITAWILVPKYFRYRQELAKEMAKNPNVDPQQAAEVKRLRDRVENLEALICRLDTEINYQLEKSATGSKITTLPDTGGNSQMPTTFMNIATALEGRYQVLKELGRGGMGIVFQAHDKQLNEQVAIKILSPLLSNDKEALERLKREVSAARRITHPNVIRIHDISEISGLHYVSMEYFPGISLKDHIKRTGALSLMQAYNIAGQICDGLEAAHRQGVIHRDLKTQNIIIDPSNQIKIIDFGLARASHLEGMTATGLIMGTPEYMAPEQVSGQKVDERADIYSLGIILYELFTGKVPFTGDSAIAVGFKQMKEDPPAPREVNTQLSTAVEKVILRALQKDPALRYFSVSELRADLERAVMQPFSPAAETPPKQQEPQKIKT
jgi:serine/threonine protein kinase